MRVALVRHGQTDWNVQRRYQGWKGLDLNPVGRVQAAEAAGELVSLAEHVGARWQWLASSTAERAVTTAQIIGDVLGLQPGEQSADLLERGFGVAEGMPIHEARTRWPARDYAGGESIEQVRVRVLRGLDTLAAAHEGADGIIVTHGTALRVLMWHVTGSDPGSLVNGAIAVLQGTPGQWAVVRDPTPAESSSTLL